MALSNSLLQKEQAKIVGEQYATYTIFVGVNSAVRL